MLGKYNGLVVFLFLFVACQTTRHVPDPSAGRQLEINDSIQTETVALAVAANPRDSLIREKEAAIHEYRGSRERKFDLLHTSLDLKFDLDSQWVIGNASLTLRPYFFEQEILELDAKDFDIHEIWLKGAEDRELAWRYNQQVVSIYLPRTYAASDTLTIGMRYTAKPNDNSGQGSQAITDNKGLYFINPENKQGKPFQIWTQGETEFNSKWFPTIDSPNERATHDIKLTVEDRYTTISNGKLLNRVSNGDGTRTDHWEMDIPHAPYLAAVVVGDFARVSDSVGDLALGYYVERGYEEGAKKVFENTPEMVNFFSNLLGVEFPWQKYDQVVVRDFVSGAMENTTISIFLEDMNLDEREALDSEWDYIIAHELIHQWFGNYVTLESWSNLPLNEAFADYAEYLWMEHKLGRDEADMYHMVAMENYLFESETKQVDLIRFYYEDKEDMFDRHSYAKGGRVLHMLRKHLGDEAFFASLNHYLTRHALSSVEIHDLRMAFEQVTGQDLNWFFDQWFLTSGHPELDVIWDRSQPDNILLTVRQQQDLTGTPLYRIPFKVSWYVGGERKEAGFVLDKAAQQFALENGEAVDLVMFDEFKELLVVKQTQDGRKQFERQLELSQSGVARYEALDSLVNQYPMDDGTARLLLDGLDDEFSSIRELSLSRILSNLDSFPLPEAAEEKILEIAESDPKNIVRSWAVDLLNKSDAEKYVPLMIRLVNDPSYYVAGAALEAYLANENNRGREEMAQRFLETNNLRMIVPLADYFTSGRRVDQQGWFDEKLKNINGENLYYFMGYYGDYYASVDGVDKETAVNMLGFLGLNHQKSYIRYAAFQNLFGFLDEEGVTAKIREIYEGESDERMKTYMGFYLEDLGE